MQESKTTVQSPHTVICENRSKINITGVCEVGNFDDETVVLSTDMGELTVRGRNLHISRFNVETGELAVDGMIVALFYSEEKIKGGFFSRVFK